MRRVIRRRVAGLVAVWVVVWAAAAAGCSAPVQECEGGARRCADGGLQVCEGGAYATVEACAEACSEMLGCVACAPGAGSCDGDTSRVCRPDGSGFDDVFCDPVQGMSCGASGLCEGACAPHEVGRSYIGCEYFPTVTAQLVSSSFAFAIAVANTSDDAATITIEDGALSAPMVFGLAAGEVAVRELPWVDALKVCTGAGGGGCTTPAPFETVVAPRGAYRVRSTRPVTVYQFSPLDYTSGGQFSFTNDASLLLPANALAGDYLVAGWQAWDVFGYPGLLAVTAVRDGTAVSITPRATSVEGSGGGGAPAFPAGATTEIVLDRGDVVQLLNLAGDLTGSVIAADAPVQAIAGHYCVQVPLDVPACDHLEEALFPVAALSREYAVTAPALPGFPGGVAQVIRIVATRPNTELAFDPAIPGVPAVIAGAGEFVEFAHAGDFHVVASGKVIVAQFMQGQQAGGGAGDPAMTLAVPIEQYRADYAFHAPTNYEVSYVNITAPIGATVMLDGQPITGFAPIGDSGLGVLRVQLGDGPRGDGNHRAVGSERFGISVYGHGQFTSYWYPGGLDLAEIPVE